MVLILKGVSGRLLVYYVAYLPMQHIYIADYQRLFILIGTTSVFTNTQNVGTNANRCLSPPLHIRVVPPLFSPFMKYPPSVSIH